MGFDLQLRAFPENSELLAKARIDRVIAQSMESFESWVLQRGPFAEPDNDTERYFMQAAHQTVQDHPGLLERYYYNGPRVWDKIVYLLSPIRRSATPDALKPDESLIHQAIHGVERLHPEATAGQGRPIMFVPAKDVKRIAECLQSITREQLHEHYDPDQMVERGVYKAFGSGDEREFDFIWNEFTRINQFYQEAAAHDEAVIVIID